MACSGAIKEVCKKVVKIRFFHFLEVNFIFLKKFAGFNKPLQHTSLCWLSCTNSCFGLFCLAKRFDWQVLVLLLWADCDCAAG